MRARIQNPYSLKLGNFLKFKAKNIIIKRPLVEQFALNQNHIRNIQSNNSFFNRISVARSGYFLGVSTYRDFIHRSNRIIKKKRYYISKLLRRKKMRAKLLYKIKKVEKKHKKRSFNFKFTLTKQKKAYYLIKKNVKRLYKKAAIQYIKIIKKKNPKRVSKKTTTFKFKVKKKAYKKRVKKEIKKSFFLFKGNRKYYYPRDFYLKKGKRKWEFPEKYFIKKGIRIYYANWAAIKKAKKDMLYYAKGIKKKAAASFKKELTKPLLKKRAKLIRRINKAYSRVLIPEEVPEGEPKTPERYNLTRVKYRYRRLTLYDKLRQCQKKEKIKIIKKKKAFEIKFKIRKPTLTKRQQIINLLGIKKIPVEKKKFSLNKTNCNLTLRTTVFKSGFIFQYQKRTFINYNQNINKKFENNFGKNPYAKKNNVKESYQNNKNIIIKHKPVIKNVITQDKKPYFIKKNKKAISRNDNFNLKKKVKKNYQTKPLRFRNWYKIWEIAEDDFIKKKLQKTKMLNTAYAKFKIARYRKLPKSALLNQYWDIIAQPIFKGSYREFKYFNTFEKEAYQKNKNKRIKFKTKQEKKKKAFEIKFKGRKSWEDRKFKGKVLNIPRSMQYPYAIFYNNMKMKMLNWIKKRMISAGQSIIHSKPKISLILFNTNTRNAATSIVRYLTRRFSLLYSISETIYPLIRILKKYSTGLLVIFQGRYIKRQRALKTQLQFGPASGNTFTAPLDFAQRWVTLRYGVGSIKFSMEIFKKNLAGAAYNFFFIAFRSEYYKARAAQRKARKLLFTYSLNKILKKKAKAKYFKKAFIRFASKPFQQPLVFFKRIKKNLILNKPKIIYSQEVWSKNIPIKGSSFSLLRTFSIPGNLKKKSLLLKKKIKFFINKQKKLRSIMKLHTRQVIIMQINALLRRYLKELAKKFPKRKTFFLRNKRKFKKNTMLKKKSSTFLNKKNAILGVMNRRNFSTTLSNKQAHIIENFSVYAEKFQFAITTPYSSYSDNAKEQGLNYFYEITELAGLNDAEKLNEDLFFNKNRNIIHGKVLIIMYQNLVDKKLPMKEVMLLLANKNQEMFWVGFKTNLEEHMLENIIASYDPSFPDDYCEKMQKYYLYRGNMFELYEEDYDSQHKGFIYFNEIINLAKLTSMQAINKEMFFPQPSYIVKDVHVFRTIFKQFIKENSCGNIVQIIGFGFSFQALFHMGFYVNLKRIEDSVYSEII